MSPAAAIRRLRGPFEWMRRARGAAPVIRPPYSTPNLLQRHRAKLGLLLFVLTLVYLLAFNLFGRFVMAQFLLPLGAMLLCVIWALPERATVPTTLVVRLFFAFVIALLFWPDYLAISLPGLPWITAIRLTGFPLILTFLVCLSTSRTFRAGLMEVFRASAPLFKVVVAFSVLATASVLFSIQPFFTINKLIVAGLTLTAAFAIATFVFVQPGRATRFIYLAWGIAVVLCLVALWEARLGRLPWAGHIPGFLAIEDESVQRMLSPNARRATGIVRVQAKFRNPLGFAEFLALMTPLILHLGVVSRSLVVKLLAWATLPLFFLLITKTDSRLGAGGFFFAIVLYVGLWSVREWRRNRTGLLGPALTLAFPFLFMMFVGATFFVRRLELMVWGGGAQQASNAGREMQLEAAIPKIASRPWGHGWGAGGEALGFVSQSGTLTIDSYYLSILLELGPIGAALFFGLFIYVIVRTMRGVGGTRDPEIELLIPISIAFATFIIIKAVLSEQENHPLIFILLGMASALFYRLRLEQRAGATSEMPLAQSARNKG